MGLTEAPEEVGRDGIRIHKEISIKRESDTFFETEGRC